MNTTYLHSRIKIVIINHSNLPKSIAYRYAQITQDLERTHGARTKKCHLINADGT